MLIFLMITGCGKEENKVDVEDVNTWDQALKSKNVTIEQGANGTLATLVLLFKDHLTVVLPEGPVNYTFTYVTYENGVAETKTHTTTAQLTKMGNGGVKITYGGPFVEGGTLSFTKEGEVMPRGSVPKNLVITDVSGTVKPADAWGFGVSAEAMNKKVFGLGAFAEGSATTNPDVSGFSDIAGAKAALPALLGLWGANASQIDALKTHLDDKTFQDVHSNVPQYMVATLINEVKHPGHLASMMGNNSQNAPLRNITGTKNNSSAGVDLNTSNDLREIIYGKHAYKLPPQALAVLQRTELMENNGPQGANYGSRYEQMIQKLLMLVEYANLLEKDPSIANSQNGYLLDKNGESLMLMNSGGQAIYQRLSGNLLGEGAKNLTPEKSYRHVIFNAYANLPDNETTPLPLEMKADIKALFGIEAGDTYTKALQEQVDAVLRSRFNWVPVQKAIGYKPYFN